MSGRRTSVILAILLIGAAAQAAVVKEVRVEGRGAGLVDAESVLAYTSLKEGVEFDRQAVNRDIKSIEKSGRVSSVTAEVEALPGGVIVTFVVEAKLRMHRLEISGAEDLGNKKVREELGLGVGDLVDDAALAVGVQKVKEKYRKEYYPNAKLTWTIKPVDEPGMGDVRIVVEEGRKATVKRILFVGNKNVRGRVLKKKMMQRTVNWLSFITGAGTYSPDDLETDVEALRKAYLDRGYLDVRVSPADIRAYGRKSIQVLFQISEGPLYRIGDISLAGTTIFPEAAVRPAIKVKRGEVASYAAIENSAQEVRDYYGSRGYIRSAVDTKLDVDSTSGVANVGYALTEGRLAHIQNIKIRGNAQTKDKVIRRELAVYPGEVYNEVKVRTSERRLKNLGYFSYVSSMPESTAEADRFDLVFDVEEQQTGQFLIGAGFSSVDELVGFVELSQKNFDLFNWPTFSGGGQKVNIRVQAGTKRNDYELTFTEPWFLNRRLSLGLDLYQHESKYFSDEYEQKTVGGSVTLGKALTSFDRVNLTYGLEEIDVFNVKTNASEKIRQEEGKRTKSYTTLELAHDTRNSVFVPNRGNRTTLSGTLAGGPLGADTDFYSFQLRSSQYWPLWFDHVFNIRGWAAVIENFGQSDRVPVFDRFFLGGARTIRGFKYRAVGPKDENGEPLGGQSALSATAEYTAPIAEQVRLAAFYDVGMIWEDAYQFELDNLNSSWGIGVSFDFPGFPIQLDYSWPIEHDEFNDRKQGRFSFWLGYAY